MAYGSRVTFMSQAGYGVCMAETRYRDESWLREKYFEEGMSQPKIADECGVSEGAIRRWFNKHDINATRSSENKRTEGKHHDPEWLREQYHEKGKSQREIAKLLPVGQQTVSRAFDRYDIKSRKRWEHFENDVAGFQTDSQGYEKVYSRGDKASVHRLAAVAWFGLDAVAGNHVHHKNGIKWDTRESNIEPMSPFDHLSLHKSGEFDPQEAE